MDYRGVASGAHIARHQLLRRRSEGKGLARCQRCRASDAHQRSSARRGMSSSSTRPRQQIDACTACVCLTGGGGRVREERTRQAQNERPAAAAGDGRAAGSGRFIRCSRFADEGALPSDGSTGCPAYTPLPLLSRAYHQHGKKHMHLIVDTGSLFPSNGGAVIKYTNNKPIVYEILPQSRRISGEACAASSAACMRIQINTDAANKYCSGHLRPVSPVLGSGYGLTGQYE